jgi:hypothetical protein
MRRGQTAPARRGGPIARLVLVVVTALGAGFGARLARADNGAPSDGRLFLRLGVGPGFSYESYRPEGPTAGANYAGWGPALELAAGWPVVPGLVLGGDLQSAGIFNRDETYPGHTFGLPDTLHLVEVLGAFADYAPRSRPWIHVGGTLGAVAIIDVDTYMGGAQSGWGLAVSMQGGVQRPLAGRWAIGVLARLAFYQASGNAPPPPAIVSGFLPTLLLTFTRG